MLLDKLREKAVSRSVARTAIWSSYSLLPIFNRTSLQPPVDKQTPILRQFRQFTRSLKLGPVARLPVEEADQACERPLGSRTRAEFEHVARFSHALMQYPPVPTRAPCPLHRERHARSPEAPVELEAGLAPLADLQERGPKAGDVADADVLLGPAGCREILTKGTRR